MQAQAVQIESNKTNSSKNRWNNYKNSKSNNDIKYCIIAYV
jgi:hypothetical protein